MCGFEDFKRQVEEQARRLRVRQSLDVSTAGNVMVLISAAKSDEKTSYHIAEILDDHGIGYEVVSDPESIEDLAREQICQGLLVVYGTCAQDWAKARVRQLPSVRLRLTHHAPACVVYDQPIPGKPRLAMKFPNLHLLSGIQAPDFRYYFQALQAVGSP